MTVTAGFSMLEGLPAPGVLLNPKGEKASVFANLRNWIKAVAARSELQEAGRLLGEKYRCAVLCVVARESAGGVRRNQAQELLRILGDVPEWAPQAAMALPDLQASAADLAEQPAPAAMCAARSGMMKEVHSGLPTKARLDDPAAGREVFSELYTWVKAWHKAPCRLAEAAVWLDADHRRSIFAFLCSFAAKKTVVRSRCREALWLLAGLEEWCANEAVDQTALAEALADYKDHLPQRRAGLAASGSLSPEQKKKHTGTPSPADSPARRRAGRSSADAKAEARPVDAKAKCCAPSEVAAAGLPSRAALDLPAGDDEARETFKAVKDAVRKWRHAGQFADLAHEVGLEHRRSVFNFLCSFAERKTVFREQAKSLLRQLSEAPAWLDGGAADLEAIERALASGKDSGSVSPRGEEPESPGAEMPLEDEHWDKEVVLPALAELEDPAADTVDLFRRLVVWVLVRSEEGSLDEEAKPLTVEHRGVIFSFLCTFVLPQPGGKKSKSIFRVLAQKVLRELEGCEEWRAGRMAPLIVEVASALSA